MWWHTRRNQIIFRRKGRVYLNRRGRQFSRLLAAEVCASAVVMLDTPCSEVVWRVLATHSIRQFPLHFPSRASPWAITFQLESTCLLTGQNTPRRLPHLLGLSNSPLCRRCGAEDENSAHTLRKCEALAWLRYAYLGFFFFNPEYSRSISLGAIWNLSEATGLP